MTNFVESGPDGAGIGPTAETLNADASTCIKNTKSVANLTTIAPH